MTVPPNTLLHSLTNLRHIGKHSIMSTMAPQPLTLYILTHATTNTGPTSGYTTHLNGIRLHHPKLSPICTITAEMDPAPASLAAQYSGLSPQLREYIQRNSDIVGVVELINPKLRAKFKHSDVALLKIVSDRGLHRCVAMAELLGDHYTKKGLIVHVRHGDWVRLPGDPQLVID
ncbi:hypothetical protein M011DRAFT_73669 [Sporormia fimetaria CBS 119925]|uniref:Uncharacterized protein n=1 Tax=Sporormia fimetaria CBS 119925 TaxID=1340428 RepID=A0A6A6VBR3_9PLEO|nr:hypothetical protein M011DRAFT_73669 [Sporormia fimetaria CBS 119925]